MLIVLPPGEMQPLACEACQGTTFHLVQEVRDGQVEAFHTKCAQCGKRGYLEAKVTTTVARNFVQFQDVPK